MIFTTSKEIGLADAPKTEEYPGFTQPSLCPLNEVLFLVVTATELGARTFKEVQKVAKLKLPFLIRHLPFRGDMPSHELLARFFGAVKPQQLELLLPIWHKHLLPPRGRDRDEIYEALRTTSVYASNKRLVFGQVKALSEFNNSLIPMLIKLLNFKDTIVSIDTAGFHQEIVEAIRAHGGDYILAIKENEKPHHKIATFFTNELVNEDSTVKKGLHEVIDECTARTTIRRLYTSTDLIRLNNHVIWPDAKSIICLETTRVITKIRETETRYFVSSLLEDPQRILLATQNYWDIEHRLHWMLDITTRSGGSVARTKNANANLALAKKMFGS